MSPGTDAVSAAPRTDSRAGPGLRPAYLLQAAIGGCLLGLGAALLWNFPIGRLPLMVLAVGLFAAQWRDPRAWLLAVPGLFVVLDLGVWSGRLLAGEQDALLAVLAGSALMAGQYRGAGGQLLRRSFAPLWLFALVLVIGLVRGLSPLAAPDANAWGGYLTTWNALRVAKGPLWALVFWPLLAVQLREDREATEARLALGFILSLVGFGLYVLWERGFFHDLASARNLWGLVATWLDLSDVYRITGPFSQMHLGGEAVDGYLILVWPFALWALLRARAAWIVGLAILALMLAAYAVLLTFTRTTYLAAAIAAVTFAGLWLGGEGRLTLWRAGSLAGYALLCAALLISGFPHGGTLLLGGYLMVVAWSMIAGWRAGRELTHRGSLLGLGGILVLGAAVALRGVLTSKWGTLAAGPAALLTVPAVLALGVGGYLVGWRALAVLQRREAGAILLGLLVLLPSVTLSLKSTHMEDRWDTVRADWDTRVEHWGRAVSLLPDDWPTRILGAGLGTFPSYNRPLGLNHDDGVWLFANAGPDSYLRLLGSGSLFVGQRLAGIPKGRYRLELKARNPGPAPAELLVRIQPRHLLELQNWQPRTLDLRFKTQAGQDWQVFESEIALDRAASPPWYDARGTVLGVANTGGSRSLVDVTDLRLRDQAGRDWIANGDFSQGGDRWLAFNDFEHLAWHLKSLYVALYFELGALGVIAFALLALTALLRVRGEARRGRLFSTSVGAALVGFLVLGATGTLLDVPAVMTLSVLLMVSALWRERVRRSPGKRRSGAADSQARSVRAGRQSGDAAESRRRGGGSVERAPTVS